MRGWLMMVAVLFVGIAFQGIIQPPPWMPSSKQAGNTHFGAALACKIYLTLQTVIMATALTMLVILLIVQKVTINTLLNIQIMMVLIAMSVASSFIIATSDDLELGLTLLFSFVDFIVIVLCCLFVLLLPKKGRDELCNL